MKQHNPQPLHALEAFPTVQMDPACFWMNTRPNGLNL
jgi:hypothetical protein